MKQHNENIGGYTKNRGPWVIVWFGVFDNRCLAEGFEKYLMSTENPLFPSRYAAVAQLVEQLICNQ